MKFLLCVLTAWIAFAQSAPPHFEVVSIKRNNSNSSNGGLGPRASTLVGTNVTLILLLQYAYRPPNSRLYDAQIIGAPGWARTEHFDIEAKPEAGARVLPGEQTRVMVQSLLRDRFQLSVHWEPRELPVYNLVLTKKGPKPSPDQTPPDRQNAIISVVSEGAPLSPLPRGALRMIVGPTTTTLIGTAVPVSTVVELLQGQSDRMIVDTTAFHALIDVDLEFSPELGVVEAAPPLFTALQDIGLNLQPAKARLQALVIDRVQPPSAN